MPDYTELAHRNQAIAARQHARNLRQQGRGLLLHLIASWPVPPARSDRQTILLIRPDHVGDVLLTTPAIRALAHAQPDARLIALVGPWSAGVISVYPEIEKTLTLPFPGFARHPARPSAHPYWLAWQWARKLRRLYADSAIIFRPDHWWGAMLTYLAGIPHRIGFDVPDTAPFLNRRVPLETGHAVAHNMALITPWTGGQPPDNVQVYYPVEDAGRNYIRERLHEWKFPPGAPRIIIHPGSGTLIKQWAQANWATVADRLAATWGAPVIFTGSNHEILLIRSITAQMTAPAIVLAGETTIQQLAALYEGARIVLGPDSGPLHLATAVGAPTVHLYGPADPVEFGPWGEQKRHVVLTTDIACRPCRILDWPDDDPAYHPCVRDIPVQAVINAALVAAADA